MSIIATDQELSLSIPQEFPKRYVEAMLEVHSKFGEVVNGPFRAELGFNASLDRVSGTPSLRRQALTLPQACRDFANTNAACTVPTRSPELLATYCDLLLKKSNKDSDAESLEDSLNQAVRTSPSP